MSHPITFVCCVESGLLENQTVRMIESLRRWGGRLRESPIFAVTPRIGSPLSYSHNYQSGSLMPEQWGISEKLKPVRILHHHDAMLPPFFSEFVNILRAPHPDVAEWLSSLEPLKNQASISWRATSKILKQVRSRKEANFMKLCKVL